MLRFLTAGDSHGEALLGILEGYPSRIPIDEESINRDLARRQSGYGRSDRMRIAIDRVRIVSGVWKGISTGSPIGLIIENKAGRKGGDLPAQLGSVPRPGHADLAGSLKYGFKDVSPVSERASARETAMRVAIGSLCKLLLEPLSIKLFSHVIQIGNVASPPYERLSAKQRLRVERSPVRCSNIAAEKSMLRRIDLARKRGDSLGGEVETVVLNVPPGLGSYAHYDTRLDARIALAVMSIPSVKAIEIGSGIEESRLPGSQVQDEMFLTRNNSVRRRTNNAGGIEGGVSNGEPVVVRAFVKPLPTIRKSLRSFDMRVLRSSRAPFVRSDTCVVPAVAAIAEAMVAFEIARAVTEKFGGDSLNETKRNFASYLRTGGRGLSS